MNLKHQEIVQVVVGGDEYLNELNARDLRDDILRDHPDLEIMQYDAQTLDRYAFQEATSASLLSEGTLVILENLQNAHESLCEALLSFCSDQQHTPDTWVIAQHEGGLKGRSMIKRLEQAGAFIMRVPDLKKDEAKLNFVYELFERNKRHIAPEAAQRLVTVLGNRTAELAALCAQLCFDFDDEPIGLKLVDRYLTGNPQITGYFIADQAVSQNFSQAIASTRSALLQGVDAIAIIAALAAKIRGIAKVIAIKNGSISQAEAKMNSWAIKFTMRQAAGWDSAGIASCLQALAWADEQCKGGGADQHYALEYCLRLITNHGRQS